MFGDLIFTAVAVVFGCILLWCLFWGAIGAAIARARGWSMAAGAALCIVLNVFAIPIIFFVTRAGRDGDDGGGDGFGSWDDAGVGDDLPSSQDLL